MAELPAGLTLGRRLMLKKMASSVSIDVETNEGVLKRTRWYEDDAHYYGLVFEVAGVLYQVSGSFLPNIVAKKREVYAWLDDPRKWECKCSVLAQGHERQIIVNVMSTRKKPTAQVQAEEDVRSRSRMG